MHHNIRTWLSVAILACVAAGEVSAREPVKLKVDCSIQVGDIKFLTGVNNGPWASRFRADLSEDYHDMGVDYIRTHDYYGPCDIHEIFPNWNADANSPASYDFSRSDAWISAIVDNNFIPYFRLGESWERPPEKYNNPPPDFDKFANVCVHIVRHYNQGWANGFYHNIRYWEIWNEPDIRKFWTGGPRQFYDLYDRTAKALKAHNPNLMVGGPGMAKPFDTRWRDGFLDYCASHSTPLDFFSWHNYGVDADRIRKAAFTVQDSLDKYGFDAAQSHITEWNTSAGRSDVKDIANAVYTAAAFTIMQDTPIVISTKYRGDDHGLGMFHGTRRAKPSYAFTALHRMKAAPRRLSTEDSELRSGILAGRNPEGTVVMILVNNFESRDTGYDLTVSNLPWADKPYTYQRYVIDEFKSLEKVQEKRLEGTPTFSVVEDINNIEVHLICLRKETASRPSRRQ